MDYLPNFITFPLSPTPQINVCFPFAQRLITILQILITITITWSHFTPRGNWATFRKTSQRTSENAGLYEISMFFNFLKTFFWTKIPIIPTFPISGQLRSPRNVRKNAIVERSFGEHKTANYAWEKLKKLIFAEINRRFFHFYFFSPIILLEHLASRYQILVISISYPSD